MTDEEKKFLKKYTADLVQPHLKSPIDKTTFRLKDGKVTIKVFMTAADRNRGGEAPPGEQSLEAMTGAIVDRLTNTLHGHHGRVLFKAAT